jgi:hypothetical protein
MEEEEYMRKKQLEEDEEIMRLAKEKLSFDTMSEQDERDEL